MPYTSVEFAGRWMTFSLAKQFANIGSEISRAMRWQERDHAIYERHLDRAFDLIDLTIADPRWRYRLKEVVRFRELVGDAMQNGLAYGSSFSGLERYCTQFAGFV